MRTDLLLQLADLLESNSNNPKGAKFYFMDFGFTEEEGVAPGLDCGTTACAVGLAAISGLFPRLGFAHDAHEYTINITLDGVHEDGFKAAQEAFEISYDDSCFLFANVPLKTQRGADAERELAQVIRWFAGGKSHDEIMTAMGY